MFLWNALRRWTNGQPKSAGRKRGRAHARTKPLLLEALEARFCPSGGYLLISSENTDSVLRYDESSGAFVDAFVPAKSGGLRSPTGILFGPADHNLYVASGLFQDAGNGHKDVQRYDGRTGAFLDDFADDKQVTNPKGNIFGPDGDLYVANVSTDDSTGTILRYDGRTGEFLGDFVGPNAGGLRDPNGLVFGPDGKNDGQFDLYVADATGCILRWDANGTPLGQFVPTGSGGLDHPLGLTFGPDGDLYVCSKGGAVLRYDGTTGAFLGAFVPPGSGGLHTPFAVLFGPDGNGDGRQDLYVSSVQISGFSLSTATMSEVLRYDGVTGAFLGVFVPPDSGGLSLPGFMTFTETDPTTLAYNGGTSSGAATLRAARPATGAHVTSTANRHGLGLGPSILAGLLPVTPPVALPASAAGNHQPPTAAPSARQAAAAPSPTVAPAASATARDVLFARIGAGHAFDPLEDVLAIADPS